jgi:hypothetical protein
MVGWSEANVPGSVRSPAVRCNRTRTATAASRRFITTGMRFRPWRTAHRQEALLELVAWTTTPGKTTCWCRLSGLSAPRTSLASTSRRATSRDVIGAAPAPTLPRLRGRGDGTSVPSRPRNSCSRARHRPNLPGFPAQPQPRLRFPYAVGACSRCAGRRLPGCYRRARDAQHATAASPRTGRRTWGATVPATPPADAAKPIAMGLRCGPAP